MNIIAQRLKKELKMLGNSQIFYRFIFEFKKPVANHMVWQYDKCRTSSNTYLISWRTLEQYIKEFAAWCSRYSSVDILSHKMCLLTLSSFI